MHFKGMSSRLLHGSVDQCLLAIWWSGIPNNVAAVGQWTYDIKVEMVIIFCFVTNRPIVIDLRNNDMITGKSRGDQTCTTKTPITENVEYKGKTLKVGVSVRDVNTKDIININVFSFSCAIWFLLHTALAAIFSCLVLFEIIKAKYLSTRAYVAFHISFFQCVISCRPC